MVDSLVRSWNTELFTDIYAIDMEQSRNIGVHKAGACPDSHPEELVFDVWQGSTIMCDCLQKWGDREYEYGYDRTCDRYSNSRDSRSPESTKDCIDVRANPPIIMNSVNGIKVCASRGSGLTYANIKRPVWNSQ